MSNMPRYLPELASYDRDDEREAEMLNNRIDVDLENQALERVRCRVSRVLEGNEYQGLLDKQLTNVRVQLTGQWLPGAIQELREQGKRRAGDRGRPAGVTAEDLSRVLREVQLGTQKSQLTLAEIEKGLPIKVQRELATALMPLSKGDKLPA